MSNHLVTTLMRAEVKLVPWSERSSLGQPNIDKNDFTKTSAVVILHRGMFCGKCVVMSISVRI